MCVICVKPEKADMPSEDKMRDMFIANSDGAGFMYVRNKKVIIRKGFMKFAQFMTAIEKEKFTSKDTVIMHFRIATAGSKTPKNCHPFPLSDKLVELRAGYLETDIAMAHNGILDYEDDDKNDLSDTATFVYDILSAPEIRKHIFKSTMSTMLEMSIGSNKMVFLNKNKQMAFIGKWVKDEEEKDGLHYSNLSFKIRSIKKVYNIQDYQDGWGTWDSSKNKWDKGHMYDSRKEDRITWQERIEAELAQEQLNLAMPIAPVAPVCAGDLDADAYHNWGRGTTEFVGADDTNCPMCGGDITVTEKLTKCNNCGVALYRIYDTY